MTGGGKESPHLTRDQVVSVIGERDEATIAAILASGAGIEDVIEALSLAEGSSDITGMGESSLTSAAAEVYQLLTGNQS